MSDDFSIRDLQKAQQWNARAIAAVKPGGAYGRTVQVIVSQLQRVEITLTHVDTGTLRASQRMELNGLRGRVYIDPSARNPRTGARPADYGAAENARGGDHAFAENTVRNYAPRIVGQAIASLGRELL